VTTLPTSPFPELRPLDESRQVPSLAELLSTKTSLPVETGPPPSPQPGATAPAQRPPLGVPRFPTPEDLAPAGTAPSGTLGEMPVVPQDDESANIAPTSASIAEYMAVAVDPEPAPIPAQQFPQPFPQAAAPTRAGSAQSPTGAPEARPALEPSPVAPPSPTEPASLTPTASRQAESRPECRPFASLGAPVSQAPTTDSPATDEDLKDALLPILAATLEQALHAPKTGLHTYLEPMLRSTVRRAIAEQMESSGQFRSIGAADRLAWRLSALFTSRSYDEIVFDRTRRYQVEELFLLRLSSHTLISYASHDPVRHTSRRRIESTVRTLVSKLRDADGRLQPSFDLPERRVALVRSGAHSLLVAVLRGTSNALVRADLDYVQRQAEERFGTRLNEESDAFLHALQPILEGGLLIQSPAPPR